MVMIVGMCMRVLMRVITAAGGLWCGVGVGMTTAVAMLVGVVVATAFFVCVIMLWTVIVAAAVAVVIVVMIMVVMRMIVATAVCTLRMHGEQIEQGEDDEADACCEHHLTEDAIWR